MHAQSTALHTVTATDTEGKEYRFASHDGRSYLELRDLTGVTPEGLRDVMENGRLDPETGRRFLPMCFDRRFFSQLKHSESIATVVYTDPEN